MIWPGRIFAGTGFARHGGQGGVIEHLAGALGHHHAQALAQHLQGGWLQPQPTARGWPFHQVGSDQPAPIGSGRIEACHLDRGHLQGPLANRRGDGVHGCPGFPQDFLFPGGIAEQP